MMNIMNAKESALKQGEQYAFFWMIGWAESTFENNSEVLEFLKVLVDLHKLGVSATVRQRDSDQNWKF